MGFAEFITENTNGKKLIIVDVQPAYASYIPWIRQFGSFVSQYQDILCLYNGPELGFESKSAIANFYLLNGIPRETIAKMKWFEKNYAFFRDLIDTGWDRNDIIKLVRFMLRNKIRDIRQLSREDVLKLGIDDLEFEKLEDYGFYIPDLARLVRKYNGADICGGGYHECLEEVMILGDALNLNFKIQNQFTY